MLTPFLLTLLLADPAAEARARFEQGLTYQKTGRLAEAEKAFSHAATLAPKNFAVLGNLGVVRAQLGNYQGAVEAYESALRLNPSAHRLHLNIGIAHFKGGGFGKAEESLKTFLQHEPGNAQAQELRGLSLYQLGRYRESADLFKKLLDASGETLPLLYAYGQSLMRSGDPAGASAVFAHLFSRYPHADETKLLRAQAFMAENRHEEAIATMESIGGKLPGVALWRGIALEKTGRLDEALDAYRSEIVNTGDLLASYAAGILEEKRGNYSEAVRLLERARPIDGATENVSYYLGRSYARLGRLPEALAALQTSLSRRPDSSSERYLMMDIYRKLGRIEEAKKEADIIRELKARELEKDSKIVDTKDGRKN